MDPFQLSIVHDSITTLLNIMEEFPVETPMLHEKFPDSLTRTQNILFPEMGEIFISPISFVQYVIEKLKLTIAFN